MKQEILFIRSWVATDGITTVRFLDSASARIYAAETGFPFEDMFVVGIPLTVREIEDPDSGPRLFLADAAAWSGAIYDPESSDEVTWHDQEGLYLPYLGDLESRPSEEYQLSDERVAQIGYLSYRTGWPFRDLAASIDSIIDGVAAYVQQCESEGKSPTMDEAMQVAFRGSYTHPTDSE